MRRVGIVATALAVGLLHPSLPARANPSIDGPFVGELAVASLLVARPRIPGHSLVVVASPHPTTRQLSVYIYDCARFSCTTSTVTGGSLTVSGRAITLTFTVPGEVGKLRLTGTLGTTWSAATHTCSQWSRVPGQPSQTHDMHIETVNSTDVTWHDRKGNPAIKATDCRLYATAGTGYAIRNS